MSYKNLEHSTDALIEVRAPNLTKAFEVAGKSVVQTIIDDSKIDESAQKKITVEGKDLDYLLYNWLEEIIILTKVKYWMYQGSLSPHNSLIRVKVSSSASSGSKTSSGFPESRASENTMMLTPIKVKTD